jgi:hypothetical protein
MYCNFKTSYIITVLFSIECHLSHNFIFLYSNNAFFVNHVLSFKYEHGRLLLNIKGCGSQTYAAL